jgi:LL-diaminopimelate aminotransferase
MNDIPTARRVRDLGAYAFAEVDRQVQELKKAGIEPTDFGVGDPTDPTPTLVREACKEALDRRATYGYPSYIGDISFREAASDWIHRRFGVRLDPATEITSTIGSKEAIFHFPLGFLDPGDVAIGPTPGYPPYARGTAFAGGEPYHVPLRKENGFLPDLTEIPESVWEKAKILWLCYPNSPTGAMATRDLYEQALTYSRKYGTLVVSDEAYTDIYFSEERPLSLIEVVREGAVSFFSLSKRSAMTGYRVGFLAGDPSIVEVFRKVKTNIDSGTPTFVQDAAVAALADEDHVARMRQEYRDRRDVLVDALRDAGLPECRPDAALYVWQEAPAGVSDLQLAKALLSPDVAIVTTPGTWIAEPTVAGENPGEGRVRFALVPSMEATRAAAERIRSLDL